MAHQHHSHAGERRDVAGSAPPLVQPEPQRINPDLSKQLAEGIGSMGLDRRGSDVPHRSLFPQLAPRPAHVPPADDELEARLEAARVPVLNSNDAEMQLAWAADALIYCGVCADEAERAAAARPSPARPATPRIERQIRQDAMNIVTFLADQQHPRAEFLRGMWLEWGRFGLREDKKEAFRCYSRAADKGYARAEYRIGMLYESYHDPVKALRHYQRGVDAGDAASCYRLGMMTLRGQHGQPQDWAKGVALIKQSADGADENAAQGAYVYGMLLARQLPQVGLPEGFLPHDERAAKENIEKAAYMRFAKAQAKMGSAYELGSLGCEFNPALSIHYNALASKQGEADADMALSKWFLVGHDALFPKNDELAYYYAERAARSGLPMAEFALGYFHEIGVHVPVDLDTALEWYQKAAKHGNDDAKGRIDGIQKKQVLSKQDHESVALNRIRSTHGSVRGPRPDRLRHQQEPGLASVSEAAAYAPYGHGYGAAPPPARGTTPYPEDDGPPRIDSRSASVAPYPTGDGPPSDLMSPRINNGPGPAGGFVNGQQRGRPGTTINQPHHRPSSAFHVNPDLRAASAQPLTSPPGLQPAPGHHRPYSAGLAAAPLRPQIAQPMAYDQRHVSAPGTPGLDARPVHPSDPRARPGAGHRIASTPADIEAHRPLPSGATPPAPGNIQHNPTAPAGPAQGLGFSAPFEERRPTVDPTYSEVKPSRRRDPRPNDTPQPSSSSRPATARPSGGAPTPPHKVGLSTAPPAKTAPAAAKPPGKGPKTFDEMGILAQPQDKECVVM